MLLQLGHRSVLRKKKKRTNNCKRTACPSLDRLCLVTVVLPASLTETSGHGREQQWQRQSIQMNTPGCRYKHDWRNHVGAAPGQTIEQEETPRPPQGPRSGSGSGLESSHRRIRNRAAAIRGRDAVSALVDTTSPETEQAREGGACGRGRQRLAPGRGGLYRRGRHPLAVTAGAGPRSTPMSTKKDPTL